MQIILWTSPSHLFLYQNTSKGLSNNLSAKAWQTNSLLYSNISYDSYQLLRRLWVRTTDENKLYWSVSDQIKTNNGILCNKLTDIKLQKKNTLHYLDIRARIESTSLQFNFTTCMKLVLPLHKRDAIGRNKYEHRKEFYAKISYFLT